MITTLTDESESLIRFIIFPMESRGDLQSSMWTWSLIVEWGNLCVWNTGRSIGGMGVMTYSTAFVAFLKGLNQSYVCCVMFGFQEMSILFVWQPLCLLAVAPSFTFLRTAHSRPLISKDAQCQEKTSKVWQHFDTIKDDLKTVWAAAVHHTTGTGKMIFSVGTR
jgi:hypothetical protein